MLIIILIVWAVSGIILIPFSPSFEADSPKYIAGAVLGPITLTACSLDIIAKHKSYYKIMSSPNGAEEGYYKEGNCISRAISDKIFYFKACSGDIKVQTKQLKILKSIKYTPETIKDSDVVVENVDIIQSEIDALNEDIKVRVGAKKEVAEDLSRILNDNYIL